MDDESTHSEASEADSSAFHADETSSSSRLPSTGTGPVSSGDDNSMNLGATFPADVEIPYLRRVYIKRPDRDDAMSILSKKFAHSREWAIRGLLDIMPMSTIHVAQHKSGALHAIKSVYVESTRAARSRIADLRVLRMLQQNQHPFLLGPPPEQGDRFYWASWNGFLNIVTPFCPYGDLARQCGKVDKTQLFYIAAEMVLAISFLHENNIVHADVRPDNIFINTQGHSVLSDFENATRSKDGFFISDAMKGMRRYMAPEIIGGRDRNTKLLRSVQNSRCTPFKFSVSTDWWSLGITLLELWAGKTPNSPYKDDLFSHFQYSHYNDPNAWENFTQKAFNVYVKECLSVAEVPSGDLTQFILSILTVEPKQRRDLSKPWTDHEYFDEIEGEVGWSRIRDGQRAPFSKEWRRDHETPVRYPYIKKNNPEDEWPALNVLCLFRTFEKEHLSLTVEERYDPADVHRPRGNVFETMHV
ncbi:hypothetical protein HETIRDRAFT_454663 [Heterobasidion irregulare TC 32-1]|uniref:Protein kinase domain-containing protein n=1 Tax=Heterobasidion irregulare (strain TC 32-1) TaxID=747525 RepID=W4JW79_HETIT|nr:uncharacterized protein HETIRDRAFT_454663 [Heterobasidion irregulare TC 32-1]ETW77335.1 hypothetical protein HETIRDRAFT_454663 [Heterobasidion irregulare TC 32-1]